MRGCVGVRVEAALWFMNLLNVSEKGKLSSDGLMANERALSVCQHFEAICNENFNWADYINIIDALSVCIHST